MNAIGEIIYSKQAITGKTEIDLSELAQGVYFLQVQTQSGIITKKVIKE